MKLETYVNAKVQNRILELTHIPTFISKLEELANVISKHISTVNIESLVRTYNAKLYMLRDTLTGNDRKFYNVVLSKAVQDKLTTLYNKIYIPIKYKETNENFEKQVSTIFAEFMKGITYFRQEMQPIRYPIYHRNASCGFKRETSIYRFSKTLYVRRCLIERLVYDRLYQSKIRMQNIGHKFELQQVTHIYDSYFPERALTVSSIDYDDQKNPINVTIETFNKGKLIERGTHIHGERPCHQARRGAQGALEGR
jgi:hypothetical protein